MRKQIGLLLLSFVVTIPLQAFAEEASELAGLREDIRLIGDDVCGKFLTNGQTVSADAKVGITVGLNQILKKFLNGKVEGQCPGESKDFQTCYNRIFRNMPEIFSNARSLSSKKYWALKFLQQLA